MSRPVEMTRVREETPAASHGSRTLIVNEIHEEQTESDNDNAEPVGVLRLTGDMSSRRPRSIRWDESVVDNEHMNKKKTKSKLLWSYATIHKLTWISSLLYLS